jgi:hypothetical protein
VSEDGLAAAATASTEEAPAPVKHLPGWAPFALGAIFVLQILVIAAASITGLHFGQDIAEARRAAADSALRAHAYAKYAECLADAAALPDEAARKAASAQCVKPAE